MAFWFDISFVIEWFKFASSTFVRAFDVVLILWVIAFAFEHDFEVLVIPFVVLVARFHFGVFLLVLIFLDCLIVSQYCDDV